MAQEISRKTRKTRETRKSTRSTRTAAWRATASANEIFERTVDALSRCGEDAISRAMCPGIVDPDDGCALAAVGREDAPLYRNVPFHAAV